MRDIVVNLIEKDTEAIVLPYRSSSLASPFSVCCQNQLFARMRAITQMITMI